MNTLLTVLSLIHVILHLCFIMLRSYIGLASTFVMSLIFGYSVHTDSLCGAGTYE